VGLCYEGVPWFTGAAVMLQDLPRFEILLAALLYAIGAHGIMTLNDFKAIEGDTKLGIQSLPVSLGPRKAALVACAIMAIPQIIMITYLFSWGLVISGICITLLLIGQMAAMAKLLKDPEKFAPWYNATGVLMYVSGMMVCAVGLRHLTSI
jgi:chlorophyll synthase